VQHAVRELRVLGDVAQAGVRVSPLGQRLQRGSGELVAALGELVHLPARDHLPVPNCHDSTVLDDRPNSARRSSSNLLTTVKTEISLGGTPAAFG
jgi:hypothetical protein